MKRASLTHINLFDRTSASASPLSESRSFAHFISQPVNRPHTYAQRLREIGKLRCQSTFLFLFLFLVSDHDSCERVPITVQAFNKLISFPCLLQLPSFAPKCRRNFTILQGFYCYDTQCLVVLSLWMTWMSLVL